MSDHEKPSYGSAEHAATEALEAAPGTCERWVNSDIDSVAAVVVAGLRERGFTVSAEPRCECGWTGTANHYHDMRMGRAQQSPSPAPSP